MRGECIHVSAELHPIMLQEIDKLLAGEVRSAIEGHMLGEVR